MSKYNYIVLGSDWSLYLNAYADIINLPNVKYYKKPIENKFLSILYRIHTNTYINNLIPIPFKRIWNYFYYNTSFQEKKPLCFILFPLWYYMNNGIIEHIRKHYPTAKIVIIFQDLIKTMRMKYTNLPIDIDKLKSETDMVISFDFGDAKSYGITYHHIPYSSPKFNLLPDKQYESDVYFIGQAKDRLDEIMEVYHHLKSFGLKLNFILSRVPLDKQDQYEGITYLNDKQLSYEENLKNIVNTKCLLEIMQHGGTGYTIRTLEAISYDKKLITNNRMIKQAPFYNQDYISCLSKNNSIDPIFIQNLKSTDPVDYQWKKNISPIELLDFIESRI